MSGVGLGAGSWTTGATTGYLGASLVGFLDASQVTLSIDDASRTVTVTPTGAFFTVYVEGKKFDLTTAQSIQWPDDNGLHYFYFNTDGVLSTITPFTIDLISKFAFCAILYWDKPTQTHVYWGNERHGIYMGTSTHAYLHQTRGAQWERELGLVNFNVDGTGNLAIDGQFTAEGGVIWDEDIKHTIPAQAQIPILYKSGSTWKKKTADAFPIIHSGTAGYTGTRLPYNLNTAGVWSLAEVDLNKFVLVHIFATNDIDNPVVGVQGTNEYISKSAARTGANVELETLSDLPFAEFAPLGSVIFETRNSYTNAIKGRVVSTDTGSNYVDKRGEYFRPDTK
jgi:hypothetical protein